MPVTHTLDPLPRNEVIALGAQAGAPALGPQVVRYFHDGHLHRIFGKLVNVRPDEVIVHFEHSDDDGDTDPYAALDVDYNGSIESALTVVGNGVAVFSLPDFGTGAVKKWFRVRVEDRLAHGFVTLSYFTGVLLTQPQDV